MTKTPSVELAPEFPRPLTKAVSDHRQYSLAHATQKIEEYGVHNQPIKIFSYQWSTPQPFTSLDRNSNLSICELDDAIKQILRLCEIPEPIHDNIFLLHTDTGINDDIVIEPNFFKKHVPTILELLNRLGDKKSESFGDDPNDFCVGVLLASKIGFVAVKYESQEFYDEEVTPNTEETQEDIDRHEVINNIIEICIFPANHTKQINWGTNYYSSDC